MNSATSNATPAAAQPASPTPPAKVRWGILSTALIGTEKVVPALRKAHNVEVVAIASRDAATARRAADALGIPTAHGSYEALLQDPAVEVVYNPLPNHLHVPWTLAAVQAGKHVLCEKPMALGAAELEALRPYAGQVHIAEAFMVRHHPQWLAVREQVRQGAIGALRCIQVPFSYYNDDPANIRNRADIGGGALYDIGGYAIVAGRWFFEAEPLRVSAMIDRDPRFGTDRHASAWLDFGQGRQLTLTVSTQTVAYQRVQLLGTHGRLEIETPFNAPQTAPVRWGLDTQGALDGSSLRWTTVPVADQYQLQAEAFSAAVRGQPPDARGLDDAIQNLRIIEALFRSAASGTVQPL